jgi:protein TonB
MNPTVRRWMTAFMLALAAHAIAFHLGFRWGKGGSPGPARQALDGPIAVTMVQAAPAAPAAAPAPPSAPPETPPEPTPVPEVAPVLEPKPVLTEPAPEVPAVPPEPPPAPAPVPQVDPEPAPAPEAPAASAVASSAVPDGPVGPESVAGSVSGAPGLSPAEGSPSGGSGGAAPLSSIHPRYPMGSRIRGEEGPVRLSVKIDGRGRPIQTEVVRSSGFFALDAAAVKAVKGARFVAPAPGASRESFQTELTIRFQLKDP